MGYNILYQPKKQFNTVCDCMQLVFKTGYNYC